MRKIILPLNYLRFKFHCMVLGGSSEAISSSARTKRCLIQTPCGRCLTARIRQLYAKDQLWLPAVSACWLTFPGVQHSPGGSQKIHPQEVQCPLWWIMKLVFCLLALKVSKTITSCLKACYFSWLVPVGLTPCASIVAKDCAGLKVLMVSLALPHSLLAVVPVCVWPQMF